MYCSVEEYSTLFWLLYISSSIRNPYEGHHFGNESRDYTTFENDGFNDYSTIEDIGDPNKNPYLTPIDVNKSQNWYQLCCEHHLQIYKSFHFLNKDWCKI